MSEARVLYCQSCGAMLNVDANRAYIFCQYCGAKNVIASEQMKANINIGGIQITAKTEIENIIASAEYAVSIGQYSKANEMLVAAIRLLRQPFASLCITAAKTALPHCTSQPSMSR